MDKELARQKEIEQLNKENLFSKLNLLNSNLAELDFIVRRQQPIGQFFKKILDAQKLINEALSIPISLDYTDKEQFLKRIKNITDNLVYLKTLAENPNPIDSFLNTIYKTKETLAEAEAIVERIEFNFG